MLASFLVSIVDFSRKFAKSLAILGLLVCVALGDYVATHIAINTDINQLLSDHLDWRKREKELEAAFPQKTDNLVIVIDGDSPGKAERAAEALAKKLEAMPDKFTFVARPDALPFFRTNGLLFLSKEELGGALDQIAQAQPMLGIVISDPSLRGFLGTIGLMMQGVQAGATDPAQLAQPLNEMAAVFQAALNGKSHELDLQKMMPGSGQTAEADRELRKYIITKPVLDYSSLQPGEAATKIVRVTAQELGLTSENGFRVRLTGSVPLNDEEFASVAEGTGFATILSGLLVLALLFLAMRSWRIVVPIALTLGAGLILSTAFACFAVGSLNLISAAFAVMFIGIAVDFGIQFGVRYRDQHHSEPDHANAMRNTARVIAVPLAMAAASTAIGFLAFTPTDYRGVSELGLIAGSSMIIAFILNITLLPALMTLMKPPAEAESVGYQRLAPLNNFLLTHRMTIMPLIAVLILVGLALAAQVRFDFDPLDLKNPQSESVSTMFEAMQDPDSDAYTAQILAPSPQQAQILADDLSKLPEVDHVMTLSSFIPEDQDKKLSMINDTANLLGPTFSLPKMQSASDADNLDAIRKTSSLLHQAGAQMPAAQNLADLLDKLAAQNLATNLKIAQDSIVTPLNDKLEEIIGLMQAKKISLDNLPPALKHDWLTPDGRWLIEAFPKRGADNNPRDPQMLDAFIQAVQKISPTVAGTPVSIRESGRTIVKAFTEAGIYGFAAIALLSLAVLRRLRDVILMLTPLMIAGILTLGTISGLNWPLNYANVIALPLLFSLGVSYAVYFVFYAKSGRRDFLQSSMARAVLFSAATVLVAFASLCFSSHPGTRGMGELLTIALLYSLFCTFFILPVLYGPQKKDTSA